MTRRGLACCLVGVVAFLTCCVAQDAVTDEVAGADRHTTTESSTMGGDPFGPSDLSGPAGTATCRHWPSLQCSQLSCSGRGVIDCRDRELSVADDDVIRMLATSFYIHLKSTLLAGFVRNSISSAQGQNASRRASTEASKEKTSKGDASEGHAVIMTRQNNVTVLTVSQQDGDTPLHADRSNLDIDGITYIPLDEMAVGAAGRTLGESDSKSLKDKTELALSESKDIASHDETLVNTNNGNTSKITISLSAAGKERTQASADKSVGAIPETATVQDSKENNRARKNNTATKRRRRRSTSVALDPTSTNKNATVEKLTSISLTATVPLDAELKSFPDESETVPEPSELIFDKMRTNKLPSSANNVGKGKVLPVDLEQRTSRKTLVYQVTVNAGVNVSKADESNINENATGDSVVTWIKPLEESTESTASYDINKEQSADQKRLAHTPEEKLTKTEMVSSHQINSPPSVTPTSTDVSTQSAVTKMPVTQVSRITSRLNNGRDITINEMSLVDKSASDAARNQTATNSSILPEQLEQFQSMLLQIMEDDEDFLNADKEQVRDVLLEQTQFPYLAGTVQAGSSGSCTLYNITCQPPVPLRANCTGISPVVCVDPPGKAGRDRSGVFHLVLQLLVGACVLFMPLIWIICRKQPNEVVANGNI